MTTEAAQNQRDIPSMGRIVHYVSVRAPMHAVSPAIILMSENERITDAGHDKYAALAPEVSSGESVHLLVWGVSTDYREMDVPHAPNADVPRSWHWHYECPIRPCKQLADLRPTTDPPDVLASEMPEGVGPAQPLSGEGSPPSWHSPENMSPGALPVSDISPSEVSKAEGIPSAESPEDAGSEGEDISDTFPPDSGSDATEGVPV